MTKSLNLPLKSTARWITLGLTVLALTACNGAAQEAEETVIPPTPVTIWELDETPTYVLTEVGTVKPFQEVEVVAKTGGIVGQLNVKVGDSVTNDQVLGKIDQSSNDAAVINLSNANNQLLNARNNYDETIANNKSAADQIQLQIESLKDTITLLQRNLRELQSGNMNTETSLNLQISNANENVQNAEVGLDNLEQQFDQSWDNFFRSTEVTFDGLFVNGNSYHQTAKNILSPGKNGRIQSDDILSNFGASSSSQRNRTINLYNDFLNDLDRNQEEFEELLPLDFDNFDEAVDLMNEVVDLGRQLNEAMRELLNRSTVSTNLSQATLDGYKAQIASAEGGSLQDLATLNGVENSYQDLQLQQTTQLETSRNNLTVTQNQLNDAQNSLDRFNVTGVGSIQDLENQIEATKRDLDNAYLNYENALRNAQIQNDAQGLQIQTFENQVRLAERALEDANILAPISGIVSDVFIDEGDNVNPGTQIVKINQQDQLKVIFYVTENQAERLNVGQRVTAKLNDSENTTLTGELIQIAPTADAQNRKIKIQASFNDSMLRPEMFVTLEMNVSDATFETGVFYVPLNAVVFDQNSQSLFILEENVNGGPLAQKKEVQTGDIIDKWVEIVDGLEANDKVIFEGSRGLEQGERVEVIQ